MVVPAIVSFASLHGLVEQNVTFQFLMVVAVGTVGEVFKVFARDRFLLLHPLTHLVLRMRLDRVFFALFPKIKSGRLGRHTGSELSADLTPCQQLTWLMWLPCPLGSPAMGTRGTWFI